MEKLRLLMQLGHEETVRIRLETVQYKTLCIVCHTVKILDTDNFETFVIPCNHPPPIPVKGRFHILNVF